MPYFSGVKYQQEYGFENVFSTRAKSVLPLVKRGAKAIRKKVIHSGVDFASDVLSVKNAKPAEIDHAKAAVSIS